MNISVQIFRERYVFIAFGQPFYTLVPVALDPNKGLVLSNILISFSTRSCDVYGFNLHFPDV